MSAERTNDADLVEYDISSEPMIISKVTMDRILKGTKRPADCIALYSFYYYTAKWQRTNHAKATISYCKKGLNMSEDRVRSAKKELIDLDLVSDFKRLDPKSNKVLGWYVLVRFVSFESHPRCFPEGGKSHSVGKGDTNALSTGSLNSLNTNTLNAPAQNLNNHDNCRLNYHAAKATEDEASPAKNIEFGNQSKKEKTAERDKDNVPPDQSPAAELFDVYNTLGLAKARKLTASRRSHINARIKEYSYDEVRFVFSKAQKSRFLTGNNDRKWRADLDWLVNPTNFTKVLEGKYDDRSESQEAKILKEFDL